MDEWIFVSKHGVRYRCPDRIARGLARIAEVLADDGQLLDPEWASSLMRDPSARFTNPVPLGALWCYHLGLIREDNAVSGTVNLSPEPEPPAEMT